MSKRIFVTLSDSSAKHVEAEKAKTGHTASKVVRLIVEASVKRKKAK